MALRRIACSFVLFPMLWGGAALAVDCAGMEEWKRQRYYLMGDQVQYQDVAYELVAATSKRDTPDPDYDDPWLSLGVCDAPPDGGGGSGGGGGGEPVDPQPISIYGVWHCGDTFCDWSQPRDMEAFDAANRWIIDRYGDGSYQPSVNLVVLSFVKPMDLLLGATENAALPGLPPGMTPAVVDYFKNRGIRVLLSIGGVTYTESWNEALETNAAGLAAQAVLAVEALDVDGVEVDWENGRPTEAQMAGIETFIDTYNAMTDAALTLDLAVGNRYLQELSRRASADWLPNGEIDYVNAMVPRGEPSTDQWQEHVDGKANYDPPILPKAPGKIAVSLWLTDGRRPNPNCVDFEASSQLAKSSYVQTVQPNGAGLTHGFLGFMFWAAECPATRNVCTTPPNSCEGGMGAAATHFDIPVLVEFPPTRTE